MPSWYQSGYSDQSGSSPHAGPVAEGSQFGGGFQMSGGGGDAVGAAIGLGSMLWNNYQQKKMMAQQNAWNRQNALDAYNRDIAFWEKQNQYNSPQQMMDRWKMAGLNPNLIYGGANSGGASTSSVKSPVVESGAEPRFMIGNVPQMISQFQDVELKHAQIDNVKAQTDQTKNNTLLLALKQGIAGIKQDYDQYAKDLFLEYGSAYANQKLQMNASKAGILHNQAMASNELPKQARGQTTAGVLENEKRKADILFKKNENQWRSMGITSGDNVMLRMLVRSLQYLK